MLTLNFKKNDNCEGKFKKFNFAVMLILLLCYPSQHLPAASEQ